MSLLYKTRTMLIMLIYATLPLPGCTVLLNSPHETLSEGYYRKDTGSRDKEPVYLTWDGKELHYHTFESSGATRQQESPVQTTALPESVSEKVPDDLRLRRPSFDLDFMTILFKYRPGKPALPRQLNSDLSGAVFIGYRVDDFNLFYEESLPGKYSRRIGHIGVNQFTLGLALGWDYLLDHNRVHWIYQMKPWFGLPVGINLNQTGLITEMPQVGRHIVFLA